MPLTWRLHHHVHRDLSPDPNDGLAFDGDEFVGHVYLQQHIHQPKWFWVVTAHGPGIDRRGQMHGDAATKEEAKARVEEAYRQARGT
jgi:hypothetical protein